jgi:hypothetical protein
LRSKAGIVAPDLIAAKILVRLREEDVVWTVEREYSQSVRHMDLNRSGGSFVANLTLRLAPDLDKPDVTFDTTVVDEEARYFMPFVEQGVRAFESCRRAEGRPIGFLRVTLIAIEIHPVDAKSRRFVEAAEMALALAFDAVGIML